MLSVYFFCSSKIYARWNYDARCRLSSLITSWKLAFDFSRCRVASPTSVFMLSNFSRKNTPSEY